mmetsp:Transcript_28687/g.44936  ORF Transcript_28687/g.44936 Transcript_28687/m.44936 type:complete len:83 (-) Transcript_28687:304-552(-)
MLHDNRAAKGYGRLEFPSSERSSEALGALAAWRAWSRLELVARGEEQRARAKRHEGRYLSGRGRESGLCLLRSLSNSMAGMD